MYYWGKRTCQHAGGSNSGWAVGGGTQGAVLPCGGNYPDDADSWLIYGPFSLVGATAAELNYSFWLNTEANWDWLCQAASIDGQNYFEDVCYAGSIPDWWDSMLDLSAVGGEQNMLNQPRVWVALYFVSDEATNEAEGAYVDDVVLRKCTAPSCPSSNRAEDRPAGKLTRRGPAVRILPRPAN